MRNVLGTVIVVFSALVAGPIFAADLVPVLPAADLVPVRPPLSGPGLRHPGLGVDHHGCAALPKSDLPRSPA